MSEEALDLLFSNIWHQDTVYEATAYAVPFLVELVQSPATHNRHQLVWLLDSIADGHCHAGEKDAARIAIGQRHITRAREAVEAHFQELLDLHRDADVNVRRYLPALMAKLERGREWLLHQGLSVAAAEPDTYAAANGLLAYAFACGDNQPFADRILAVQWPNHPVIQFAVAATVMLVEDPQLRDSAVRQIVDPVLHPGLYEDYFCTCGFMDYSGMEESVIGLLKKAPKRAREPLIAALCEHLPLLDDISSSMFAEAILPMIFDAQSLPAAAEELTREQRMILIQINRATHVSHAKEEAGILQSLQSHGVLAQLGIKPRAHW